MLILDVVGLITPSGSDKLSNIFNLSACTAFNA